MKTLSKIVAVFGLLILSTGALAETAPQSLASLDAAGVTYIYSSDGTLKIFRTKETAEAIAKFVENLPGTVIDVDVIDLLLGVE